MNSVKQKEDVVLAAAIDIADPEQRKIFLEESCADSTTLRLSVEKKLSARKDADNFFAKARTALRLSSEDLPGVPVALNEITLDERIGTRIGSYKLLQKIGEGGCGVVYMAEQEKPVGRAQSDQARDGYQKCYRPVLRLNGKPSR
jgi:eukaryotic-like serine/threonine-protein kinase